MKSQSIKNQIARMNLALLCSFWEIQIFWGVLAGNMKKIKPRSAFDQGMGFNKILKEEKSSVAPLNQSLPS